MDMKTINVNVSTEAAEVYESASPEQRKKLDLILSLTLRDVARPRRSLEQIMDDISRQARERGLTPEILDSLINDPE